MNTSDLPVRTADESPQVSLVDLIDQLRQLQSRMWQMEQQFSNQLDQVVEARQASARNLLHYVALRQQDLRVLQSELASRGLSSLGRCEAHVMYTIQRVIDVLSQLSGQVADNQSGTLAMDFASSRQRLARSTGDLFGSSPTAGAVHVMVTLPSEAAEDPAFIEDLVEQGVDCVRINCAHDDASVWSAMIDKLERACEVRGKSCKVAMDLAGPKLRTGALEPGPAVLKWRPRRDAMGRVLTRARLWLCDDTARMNPPGTADAILPVRADWLSELQEGDELHFEDARGRSRRIRVTGTATGGVWAEGAKTAYVTPGMTLNRHVHGGKKPSSAGTVGTIEPSEQYLLLRKGDRLLLGDDEVVGRPAARDEHGQQSSPAIIGCTLASVLKDLQVDERVLFDDGKIASRVVAMHDRHVELEIVNAAENGTKLRADKGINLPDTDLNLGSLTEKDKADMAFVAAHADMVNYSFVRCAEDVHTLQDGLAQLGRPDLPIVLKIENRQAFEHLPTLLLATLRHPVCGVMIARGDLAVEMGWQRLAEVQEEILWLCESAHVPVIWATQVLENLSKSGVPTRAEITDAAMSVKAECVMLNKGPYILDTVRVLTDILRRMQDHQVKKHPILRRLHLADELWLSQERGNAD